MKKLPELLSNPLMIAEPTEDSEYSKKKKQNKINGNRYVVTINESDNDQKPINVVIDYDWEGNRVNIIPTAYGRNKFDDYVKKVFKEASTLNKTVYIDEKNLLLRCERVQFPSGEQKVLIII